MISVIWGNKKKWETEEKAKVQDFVQYFLGMSEGTTHPINHCKIVFNGC
jgi:hypothetical protein